MKYISLVNLILDRPLVKELIQEEFTQENLVQSLGELFDESQKKIMLQGYEELRMQLGEVGASKRAAQLMISYLKK